MAPPDQVNAIVTWQENSSLLYDFVNLHNLEWPTLSIQWLETQIIKETQLRSAYFLVGTHATEPQGNYISIASCALPRENVISMENRQCDRHADHTGFSYGKKDQKKYKTSRRIQIPFGHIHRARRSPICSLGAAITSTGQIAVFDSGVENVAQVDIRGPVTIGEGLEHVKCQLVGHDTAGWGLAWSLFDAEQLVTAADNNVICTWNLEHQTKCTKNGSWESVTTCKPVRTFINGHDASPQAVAANYEHPRMFISVGDDGRILIWDTRLSDKEKPYFQVNKHPHHQSFNGLSQSPFHNYLLATAGTDHDVWMWDLRHSGYPVARLSGHTDTINGVAFSPHKDCLLASAGADARVNLWDLRDIGKEQPQEMSADGPPELLFVHGGHPATVQDLDWAPGASEDLFVTSVDDANQWHMWRVDKSVFYREDTDEPSEDEEYLLDTFNVE